MLSVDNKSEYWMSLALEQAELAFEHDEVPVGAVLVNNNKLISAGFNQTITKHDCTLHAEIVAIRVASEVLHNYRLNDCELYVTLEPCIMCYGAINHSRIKKVFYGASDPKTGVYGGQVNISDFHNTNHYPQIYSGILSNKCSDILVDFFKSKR